MTTRLYICHNVQLSGIRKDCYDLNFFYLTVSEHLQVFYFSMALLWFPFYKGWPRLYLMVSINWFDLFQTENDYVKQSSCAWTSGDLSYSSSSKLLTSLAIVICTINIYIVFTIISKSVFFCNGWFCFSHHLIGIHGCSYGVMHCCSLFSYFLCRTASDLLLFIWMWMLN